MIALLRPTTSIRQRLLTYLLAGAAATAVILYFVVQSVARQLAQESLDNILTASAVSIVDNTRVRGGEIRVDIPYFAFSMLGSTTDERVFYAIWLGDEFLTGYGGLPRDRDTGATSLRSAEFLGDEVRIPTIRRPFSVLEGSSTLEVSVAQTLKGQRATLGRISAMAVGIGAGFFVLTAALALVVANMTIRPVNRLTRSLSRRGPADLRPVSTEVPREMAPLVATLNSFMTRLQTSLSRSEDFIAEAAHRVRTPLAIVRTQAEIGMRRAETPENRQNLREVIRAIDETSRTAGQLLDHAMVSFRADSLDDEDVSLSALAQDAVARVRPMAELKEIEIAVATHGDPHLRGDLILLQNALANLLDNALKYTPPEGRIDIAIHRTDTGPVLTIADDGPGFPENPTAPLTDRFVRGPDVGDIVGSGLGLTIAEEVIRVHGGTLSLSNRPEGGACVSVSFPSA